MTRFLRPIVAAWAAWLIVSPQVFAQSNAPFDGRPWNISSGNLSVSYVQASPVGAYPKTNYFEPPPSPEALRNLHNLGLVADEDYIAWGAVERAPGEWQWQQHDAMEKALHGAGMKYVAYNWVHFPPVWLRDQQKDKRTLLRCMEHNEETHYLSVFDPRTIEWYDHFYHALHDHFGDRVDDVYACILGPYGEGNYPLRVPDWINMGHCHEGYWCGDVYARAALQAAMKKKYGRIAKLNSAWGTDYKAFEDIQPPRELSDEKFKPSLATLPTAGDRQRWLDFITWYHQAIIDFTGESVRTVLKYYPASKVRTKPGGNARGVNPLPWGTYCPGYAQMAKSLHVVLQPADCGGAVFGDKWMGTAYQFYGVKECTEPAGDLSHHDFARRMFSDASCGAAQFFSYQYEMHAPDIQRYVHLITGKPGDTAIAVYCPTTLYRLGESLQPTIDAGWPLRDLCEYDVLDEVLITDGALTTKRYKVLVLPQSDVIEQPILDKLKSFLRDGGKIIAAGNAPIRNVAGEPWPEAKRLTRIPALNKDRAWLRQLAPMLAGYTGVDGELDRLWTCRRGTEVFVFNSSSNAVTKQIDGTTAAIEPYTIWWRAGARAVSK